MKHSSLKNKGKNYTTSTSTLSFDENPDWDWLTNELIRWVRNTPLQSDAVSNIAIIIKQYEKRKTFKQKLKQLFI